MTITRTVGGLAGLQEIEIELTPDELAAACYEQQAIFDRETVKNYIDDREDDELIEDYGITRDEAEAHIDALTELYAQSIADLDQSWEALLHTFNSYFAQKK